MKMKQSEYLLSIKDSVKKLVAILENKYEHVSVLPTDVTGTSYSYSKRMSSVNPYYFGERGFVLRAYKNGGYQEYSFNHIDDVEALAEKIVLQLDLQERLLNGIQDEKLETPCVYEEKIEKEFSNEVPEGFLTTTKQQVMDRLKKMSEKGFTYENIIETRAAYNTVMMNKMFISSSKDLIQSLAYSTSRVMMIGLKDGKTNSMGRSASGFKGLEIVDEVEAEMDSAYQDLISLFTAEHIEPGEYTIITDSEGAGLIAHEAFGHGLEQDMFVKNRAVAKYHMNEQIASTITNMYDGTDSVNDTASYFFDDDGVLSSTTQILKDGVLVAGMSDLLSSLRLNCAPTGNGRRESFERKAYTRMTNTYFGKGTSTLQEMIESTEYGFLIENSQSGMEDPKHWGIQCVLSTAKEIKDGKLTGKVFTPVILTGYVPDLLANISMVGTDVKTNGNGFCGKGWKEWVVVSDGGPYIKTKVRLG